MDDSVQDNKRTRIDSERDECGTVAAQEYISFEDGGSAESSGQPRLWIQQARVLEEVRKGKNVMVTGCAGTGKSYLMKTLREVLFSRYDRKSAVVTASTGIAALPLHGTTIHSFAGFVPEYDDMSKDDLLIELKKKDKRLKAVRRRWKKADALIIDESSMIDGALFEKLDYVGRHLNSGNLEKADRPFGVKQLIVSGDFHQLPPVREEDFCLPGSQLERVLRVGGGVGGGAEGGFPAGPGARIHRTSFRAS